MISTENPLKILVVEDNPGDFYLLNEYIKKTGLPTTDVLHANRLKDALSILEHSNPDLIFLDLALPDGQGIESFNIINNAAPDLSIIVLSGMIDKQIALHTILLGAQDYLVKGTFDETLLTKSIEYSIERKKNIRHAVENYERYHSLVKATNDTVWDRDLRNKEISWNEGIRKIFGHRVEEFHTSDEWHFTNIHPDDRKRVADSINYCIDKGEEQWIGEYRYACANGEYKYVYDRGYILLDNNNRAYRMIGVMMDITERKKKQEERIKNEIERQKLITAITVSTQEKERKQIGQELHDNINQILVTAKLCLDVALREDETEKELLYKSRDYIMKAIREIRSVSKSLILGSMKDIRLEEALHEVAENMQMNSKLTVTLSLPEKGMDVLSPDKKLAVYRIIQEQANNIVKHSRATEVKIMLRIIGRSLYISVADNGIGSTRNNDFKGIGLHNISGRVDMHNGEMEIITSPGKGYTLNIELPVD
jgi:two-component system, NarL family, sensor histidine kinase UhpB